jgi:hypothetical protein
MRIIPKPVFPFNSDDDSDWAQLRFSGQVTLWFGIICQLAAIIAAAIAWVHLGGWLSPLLPGLVAAVALSLLVDWVLLHDLQSTEPCRAGGLVAWLFWLGFACDAFVGGAAVWMLSGFSYLATVILFILPAMLWLVLREVQANVAARGGESVRKLFRFQRLQTAWFFTWSGMVFGPLIAGWIVSSLAVPIVTDNGATVRAWLDAHPRAERHCAEWALDGEPLRVAVALSGGGYRAALTHAGLLAALDDQCVPVDILSTVSGGSIIGTSYALGVPPREFAMRLAKQRPGLPNAVLNIANAFRDRTKTYRKYLTTAFFGDRALDQLPDTPTLLLNVTNLYADPPQAREVFSKGWAVQDLEKIRLADIVAASAAYPGPFQPIDLQWETRSSDGITIGDHFLVDGGVVENLGTEGIRAYLGRMGWAEWYREHPRILIVSDASGYAGPADAMVINPAADDMLLRASDIQFDTLHRLIYEELTGIDDLPQAIATRDAGRQYYTAAYPRRFMPQHVPEIGSRQPVRGSQGLKIITVVPEKLVVVVVPITAQATGKLLDKYPGCAGRNGEKASSIQARVRRFSTLNELESSDATDAFWLGHSLGQIYTHAIECARQELEGKPCEIQPRSPAITCPPM